MWEQKNRQTLDAVREQMPSAEPDDTLHPMFMISSYVRITLEPLFIVSAVWVTACVVFLSLPPFSRSTYTLKQNSFISCRKRDLRSFDLGIKSCCRCWRAAWHHLGGFWVRYLVKTITRSFFIRLEVPSMIEPIKTLHKQRHWLFQYLPAS